MEANVIMIRCKKNKMPFGARIQKEGNDWITTWAFEIDEEIAQKEGFESDTSLSGSFRIIEEYPGCPHCGARSYFVCGKCGKITCWDGSPTSQCAWCGDNARIEVSDNLELKGGGF